MANIVYAIALLASALWFAAAFRYFSFKHVAAAKMMIAKSQRDSPVFLTAAASARFLGGMNGAFALMSIMLLALWANGSALFTDPGERGALLIVLAAAHFSQFIFNAPILMNGERQGETYWNVLSGPMLFIFVMDAAQTVLNFAAGLVQFVAN